MHSTTIKKTDVNIDKVSEMKQSDHLLDVEKNGKRANMKRYCGIDCVKKAECDKVQAWGFMKWFCS